MFETTLVWEMKLEVGKFYKCRNGTKVKCLHQLKSGIFLIATDANYFEARSDGTYHFNVNFRIKPMVYDYDIISEWKEPKSRLLAFIRSHYPFDILFMEADSDMFQDGSFDKFEWRSAKWLDEPEGE